MFQKADGYQTLADYQDSTRVSVNLTKTSLPQRFKCLQRSWRGLRVVHSLSRHKFPRTALSRSLPVAKSKIQRHATRRDLGALAFYKLIAQARILTAVERIWHIKSSQGRILVLASGSKSLNILSCSLFGRCRTHMNGECWYLVANG